MTRHWLEGAPEPEVFRDAQNWIGAPGFRVRDSASYASAVYSGVFCLLALRNARDWRRGEDIRLQELQDHHIFPQAYLKRHGSRSASTSTRSRTEPSSPTRPTARSRTRRQRLPSDPDIFPSGATPELLEPHFLDDGTPANLLRGARRSRRMRTSPSCTAVCPGSAGSDHSGDPTRCGITAPRRAPAEADEPDEPAADVIAGTAPVRRGGIEKTLETV